MLKVTPKEYKRLLKAHYKSNVPLFVYGGPGIGKSDIPRQVFPEVASDLKREFREWNKLSLAEKLVAIKEPEKYFVLCDQRISQFDNTDLRGLPNMVNTDMLETVPLSWIVYFTQPKAAGVLFFDEINIAPPLTQGAAYQIIHDRVSSDRTFSPLTYVIGAGNRAEDKAFIYEMALPLRDRFDEIELVPSVPDWTDWASGNGVSPHLIAFVNWKESYFYRHNEKGTDKSSTPRGIVRASRITEGLDITSDNEAFQLICCSVGEAFATEFQAYCKVFQKLDWDEIFKNPSVVKKFSQASDKLYAVIGGLSELYGKKKEQPTFDKIIPVVSAMSESNMDYAVVCLRMMREMGNQSFVNQAKKNKEFMSNLLLKIGKFILD